MSGGEFNREVCIVRWLWFFRCCMMALVVDVGMCGIMLFSQSCSLVKCKSYQSSVEYDSKFLGKYVSSLDQHVMFLSQLFDGEVSDASDWFVQSGRRIGFSLRKQLDCLITNHKKLSNITEVNNLEQFGQLIDLYLQGNYCDQVLREAIVKKLSLGRLWGLSYLFNLCSWLFNTGKELEGQADDVKESVKEQFRFFPFDQMQDKLKSCVLRRAFSGLSKKWSFSEINDCWVALKEFALENNSSLSGRIFADDISVKRSRMETAFVLMKDFSDMIHVFYAYLNWVCETTCFSVEKNRSYFFNLLQVYSEIDKLPINKVIMAINRFIGKLKKALDKIQKEAEEGFEGWLKSKWVIIPLAVGVIIVKVAQHFWIHGFSLQSDNPSYGGHQQHNFNFRQ